MPRNPWSIDATDVTLALLHGRGEKEVLVMSDAGSGSAKFDARLDDLNTLDSHSAASDHGGSAGFFVTSTQLTMTSDNPHSLAALALAARRFSARDSHLADAVSGRIDIDDDFQATLSHLHCTGGSVGGGLLAKYIDDKLAKIRRQKTTPGHLPRQPHAPPRCAHRRG